MRPTYGLETLLHNAACIVSQRERESQSSPVLSLRVSGSIRLFKLLSSHCFVLRSPVCPAVAGPACLGTGVEMEPLFRLLDFPDELLLHISQYLEVRDILNCCLVCRRLREVLNDDKVWRRHVSPFAHAVSGLRAREQLVDPPLPSVVDNFCEQRTLYACKTRLMNNWRSGNCVEFITEQRYSFAPCDRSPVIGYQHLVYGDKYLFVCRYVNDFYSDRVEVWDVRREPVLHTTVPVTIVNCIFFIIGTKLVIVECFQVVVYEITEETEFPMLYSFVITEQSVTPERITFHGPKYCEDRCNDLRHWSVDQYLICNKFHGEGVTVLEIWDISEGTKFGSFPSPLPGYYTAFLSKMDDKWVFQQLNEMNGDEFYLLQFDVTNKQFVDSIFTYTGFVNHNVVYDDKVIQFTNDVERNDNGHYDMECVVHDLSTGVELTSRCFNSNVSRVRNNLLGSTIVFDGKFVVLCTDSFHVVDALSLETVVRFPCNDLLYITRQFKLFDSMFVLVVNSEQEIELWDIEKKRKVFTNWQIYGGTYVFFNHMTSSLVHVDPWRRVCVVHFW